MAGVDAFTTRPYSFPESAAADRWDNEAVSEIAFLLRPRTPVISRARDLRGSAGLNGERLEKP